MASVIIWTLNSLSFDGGFHYITEDIAGRSILQNIGDLFAWVFAPLGFGKWEAAVATVLGLMAKEEIVGVFGTISSASAYENAVSVFDGSGLAAFSFMVFNLLCAPCFAAMGAIRREMNDWKWTVGAIGYMCGFAYVVSLIIFQIGSWFSPVYSPILNAGTGYIDNILGSLAAVACIGVIFYLLFRRVKTGTRISK